MGQLKINFFQLFLDNCVVLILLYMYCYTHTLNLIAFDPRIKGKSRHSFSRKGAGGLTWTYKFLCPADTKQDYVPSSMDKYRLKNARLGEKKIVFRLSGTWNDIRDTIVQVFPPLEHAGGIELLRTSGPYSNSLVAIKSKHISSVTKLKEFVDQAKVYVRPLQADLPLSDDDTVENKVIHKYISNYV